MYQFVHVNSYARKVSVKAKTDDNWNVQEILDEATRKEGCFSTLIKNPQPPILVYGDPIEQINDTIETWANNTKDSKNRKTRVDAKCLLAGVFSAEPGTPPEEWSLIKADAIAWAKEKYGPRLRTILEHIDEPNPHCHFYVVPLPGEAFETVHEGLAAKKAAIANGVPKKDANKPYIEAMKKFLDQYHERVGAPNGMTRIGPGRRRLTRKEWHAEQQQAESIKQQHRKAEQILLESESEAELKILSAEAVLETANSEAKTITESAVSVAKTTIESADFEAKMIISEARSESSRIVKKTKTAASEYLSKAEDDGYVAGMRKAEEEARQSWFYKFFFKKKVEGLEEENNTLKKERDELKEEVGLLRSIKDQFQEKTAALSLAIKKIAGLESALAQAERKAALAERLESKIDTMSKQLIKAQDRNKHLESVVESLTPKSERKHGKPHARELGEEHYSR
ncbi:hypothetical protein EQ828_23665 [Ectopseudomonas mendocina]|nr:hypothetical protein [Pseudomonas mendocina]TRO11625.1 hypothetical protein EQ828_23665 [Pseudomonas mendocina]